MSDRFILKQFAGNATISGDAEEDKKKCTGIFGSCVAGTPTLTNDFKQVQSTTAFEDGWSAATLTNDKLPPANEMQGLQGLLCKAIKEIYSEGIPEWIDGETYYLNSFVQYNGVVYRNITGTSTSTAPDSDTTNWLDVLSLYAPINSPAFTGNPTAPTPASTSKNTDIATTAWISDFLNGSYGTSEGWMYLGNGYVLEWVHKVTASSSPYTTVNLPQPLDSTYYFVVSSPANRGGTSPSNLYVSTFNFTTASFIAALNSSSVAVDYFIIGPATIATKP